MLIKSWLDYVTIRINDIGLETVDSFATQQIKWYEDFCVGIYCDIY